MGTQPGPKGGMSMVAQAVVHIVHFLPGRLRVKVDKVRHNAPFAEEIQRTLTALRGVHRVAVNPVTGSVLVHYDPLTMGALHALEALAETLGLCLDRAALERLEDRLRASANGANSGVPVSLGTGVEAFFGHLNADVAQATGGWGDLRTLVPLTLFFLGLRSLLLAEKVAFPSWYDYFWFAFSTFIVLYAKSPTEEK
jgi:hypothetical protein